MNDLLNRIYGFDGFGFGTDGARFGFAIPLPGWAWFVILCGGLLLAVAVYARAAIPAVPRWAATACRAALLIALAVLCLGPRLEKPRTRITTDRVLYLVDRSASMTVTDSSGISRDEQLRATLAAHTPTLDAVSRTKDARWYAFGDALTRLQSSGDERARADAGADSTSPLPDLPDPESRTTRIADAIERALDENAGHPVSAVVLFSDGKATDAISRRTRAGLSQAGVPLIAVPLGSAEREPDLALAAAVAPSIAFANDTVPVTVSLSSGDADAPRPRGGTVEITDAQTGITLESRRLTPEDLDRGEVTLPVRLDRAGEQRWTVRVVPEGPDLSPTNNETSLAIRFVDDPIRVLYLDGSPRWEQRYLKTTLIREASVDVSCLLLAADRRFQQEGNTVLNTLPEGRDEWDEFDLVILGDLRPELLGEAALRDLLEQVGDRSTGLLWIAGPSANPHAWGDSPASDLLPVRLDASSAALPVVTQPVVFSPAPAANRLGLFRELAEQSGITDADAGWSRLRWALDLDPGAIKPAAQVFAFAADATDQNAPPSSPLVVGMRYGAGRSALVATDEIWRWRYGRGEDATERFWLPLIRHLARPRLAGLGVGARLEASTRVASAGQRVVVELTVTDRETAEVLPATINAEATPEPPSRALPTPIKLVRESGESGVTRYRGAFTPLRPGPVTIRPSEDALLPEGLSTRVEVVSSDDELRNPQTDHALLASLASETGGATLAPESLDELPGLLPNRRVITPLPPETATLWDHPLPLVVLLALASLEWIIRRRSRLP